MTFANPVALALLAAIPLAWWLHRTRRSATVVRVASLLAFRGAAATTPSAAPRRATDWRLVLVLTSMVLLAVAAAGPQFGATRPPAFFVVIDDSTSMDARYVDHADQMQAAAPGSEMEKYALGDRSRIRRGMTMVNIAPPRPRFAREDGLPGSLTPFFDLANSAGFPGIVLVTDRPDIRLPDVAVIGPSVAAKANVALSGAVLDGDTAVVALRNYGPSEVTLTVRAGRAGERTHAFEDIPGATPSLVVVPSRSVATVRLPAPPRLPADQRGAADAEAGYAIWLGGNAASPPDDELAADDWIAVERTGGVASIRFIGRDSPHLRAALGVSGAKVVDGDTSDADVFYGDSPIASTDRRLLVVAPAPSTRVSGIEAIRASNPIVRGDAVIGRAEFADILPAPSTTLVAQTRLVGGTPIWSDSEGVLVAAANGAVVIAADPEDARGDWQRDPSFPALIASALDRLGGGPDRLEVLYAVPSSESDVVHDPPRTATADELRAVMRPAGPVPDALRPAPWLALAAAALLVTAAFVRGR